MKEEVILTTIAVKHFLIDSMDDAELKRKVIRKVESEMRKIHWEPITTKVYTKKRPEDDTQSVEEELAEIEAWVEARKKAQGGEYMIVESLEPDELRMPHLNLKELQEYKDQYLNSIKKKEDDIAQIQFSIGEDKTELGWIERDIKIRCQIPDFEEWKRDFKEKAKLLDALSVLYEYCKERCGEPDTKCSDACYFWDKTANECRIGPDKTGPITEWLFRLKDEMYDK